MLKERIYHIAYEVCKYMREREQPNQFADYEFCMYVNELAEAIEYAIANNDGKFLEQYYEVLNEELENLVGMKDCFKKEVKDLISLLDEWKFC